MSTCFIAIKDDQVAQTTVQEAIKRIKKSGWIEVVKKEDGRLGLRTLCNNYYWFPCYNDEGVEMIESMMRNGNNCNGLAADVIVEAHGADFAVSEYEVDLWDTYLPYDCDDDMEDAA